MSETTSGVAALTAAPVAATTTADPAATSTTTTAPAATTTAATTTTTSTAGDKWWAGFTDETMRGYAETKNFTSPEEAVRGYSNLEKLLGTKANAVMIPAADAKPEELSAFYDKLGRPAAPDNYPVPEGLKEDAVIKAFAPEAHKLGLTAKQFEGVMGFVNAQGQALDGQRQQAQAQTSEAEMAELRRENPGTKYDELVEYGRRAMRTANLDAPMLTKIEGAIGAKAMMNMLATFGRADGEAPFVEGQRSGGDPTPEGARVRIAALKKDQNWVKDWLNGDADKVAEFNKLNAIAGKAS